MSPILDRERAVEGYEMERALPYLPKDLYFYRRMPNKVRGFTTERSAYLWLTGLRNAETGG